MIVLAFDVVALPGPELGARAPSPQGLALLNLLIDREFSNVTILCDASFNKIVELWMIRAGLGKVPLERGVLAHTDEVLTSLDRLYGRLEWYIDVDPDRINQARSMGFPSLLMYNPTVEHWGMTPKTEGTWSDTLAEVIREKMETQ